MRTMRTTTTLYSSPHTVNPTYTHHRHEKSKHRVRRDVVYLCISLELQCMPHPHIVITLVTIDLINKERSHQTAPRCFGELCCVVVVVMLLSQFLLFQHFGQRSIQSTCCPHRNTQRCVQSADDTVVEHFEQCKTTQTHVAVQYIGMGTGHLANATESLTLAHVRELERCRGIREPQTIVQHFE